ncbi:MAG TPA: tripartite tricarboxylate transporter substrate-binding protein [Burkholderiales bacterium]|nr:tripartite tricarboxylate transporter substrate-binding protein [Burkholderiales bacterium]
MLLLPAPFAPAVAQDYPARPIRMVVPFSAGGPTDLLGRIMAERMGRALGQTVIVENFTGAGGFIGVGRVARAAPDGYTIVIGHWSTHVVNAVVYKLPYDVFEDFEPVALIASNPQLIVSNNAVPAKNLRELIARVKANPDGMAVGTGGIGTASHVGGVYFQNRIGAKLQFVPYRGAAPAMVDLLSGQVDMMFDQVSNSLPLVRSGRLRAYAVTSDARLAAAPEIPTVDEAGLPGLHISVWHGIWAPRGTPEPVVSKLNAAIVESLADPDVQGRLAELGQEIPARERQTPMALRAHHKAEIEKWWPLIEAAGIRVD